MLPFNHKFIFRIFSRVPSKDLKSLKENLATLCGYLVDDLELPSQFKWTNDDVLEWITNLGFPQYQRTFEANFIDGRSLLRVDASALVKMNIRDFEHIKEITRSIREMYKIELEKFDRSISLPPRNPETLYKFHKIPTGPIYELCRRTEFFKQLKLMGKAKTQLNHFENLHELLKHIPDFQDIRIGNIKRINLYFVKPNPCKEIELFKGDDSCPCTIPPCECNWSEKEKQAPWKLSFLVEVAEGKYGKSLCDDKKDSNILNLILLEK